jgi:hypothetical protein
MTQLQDDYARAYMYHSLWMYVDFCARGRLHLLPSRAWMYGLVRIHPCSTFLLSNCCLCAKAYLYLCNGPVLQQARLYAPEAERSGREKQREKK